MSRMEDAKKRYHEIPVPEELPESRKKLPSGRCWVARTYDTERKVPPHESIPDIRRRNRIYGNQYRL